MANTRFVSDCNRVSSKSVEGFDENTDTALPLDGVSVIPIIGKLKLTTLVFVGGVSEIVMLKFALPPPQFVVHELFKPLHELTAKTAASAANKSIFFEFIAHPTPGFGRSHTLGTPGIPNQTVSPSTIRA